MIIQLALFYCYQKNKTVLDAVLKWASQDNRVPMLVIDDEADNATINTKEEDDPTAINLRIRRLLKNLISSHMLHIPQLHSQTFS